MRITEKDVQNTIKNFNDNERMTTALNGHKLVAKNFNNFCYIGFETATGGITDFFSGSNKECYNYLWGLFKFICEAKRDA